MLYLPLPAGSVPFSRRMWYCGARAAAGPAEPAQAPRPGRRRARCVPRGLPAGRPHLLSIEQLLPRVLRRAVGRARSADEATADRDRGPRRGGHTKRPRLREARGACTRAARRRPAAHLLSSFGLSPVFAMQRTMGRRLAIAVRIGAEMVRALAAVREAVASMLAGLREGTAFYRIMPSVWRDGSSPSSQLPPPASLLREPGVQTQGPLSSSARRLRLHAPGAVRVWVGKFSAAGPARTGCGRAGSCFGLTALFLQRGRRGSHSRALQGRARLSQCARWVAAAGRGRKWGGRGGGPGGPDTRGGRRAGHCSWEAAGRSCRQGVHEPIRARTRTRTRKAARVRVARTRLADAWRARHAHCTRGSRAAPTPQTAGCARRGVAGRAGGACSARARLGVCVVRPRICDG